MIKCPSCGHDNDDTKEACSGCGEALLGQDRRCGVPMLGDSSAGQVLGMRYIIEELIDEKGPCNIYRAEDAENDTSVLIGALPVAVSKNSNAVEQIEAVTEKLIGLSHPAIVKMLAFETGEAVNFYVSELPRGKHLDEFFVTKKPMGFDEAIELFTPIAAAIDYGHGQDVVHGNINPHNIVVDQRASVISEFGLTGAIMQAMESITGTKIASSERFKSPERSKGNNLDGACDIYSLAACVYECMAPAQSQWRGWMEYQVIKQQPEALPGLNDAQNAVLVKALSHQPKDRYQTADEFIESLISAGKQRDIEPEDKVIPEPEEEPAVFPEAEPTPEPEPEVITEPEKPVPSAPVIPPAVIIEASQKLQEETAERIEAQAKAQAYYEMIQEIKAQTEERVKTESEARSLAENQRQLSTKASEEIKSEISERLRLETQTRIRAQEQADSAQQAVIEIRTQTEKRLDEEFETRSKTVSQIQSIEQKLEDIRTETQKQSDETQEIVTSIKTQTDKILNDKSNEQTQAQIQTIDQKLDSIQLNAQQLIEGETLSRETEQHRRRLEGDLQRGG